MVKIIFLKNPYEPLPHWQKTLVFKKMDYIR